MSNKYNSNDMVGNWLLLREVDKPDNKKTKGIYWECQCQCKDKTISILFEGSLSNGRTKSCGCSRYKDLANQTIGKLTPQYSFKKNNKRYWHCKCSCGNECDICADKLTGKEKTLSCGCLRLEKIRESCHKTNNFRYDYDNGLAYGMTSNGQEFVVDIEDVPRIKNTRWYINKQGYVVSGSKRLNRVIAKCNDDNFVVDHWNRNPLDNTKNNLRIIIQHCNILNSSKRQDNTSGMTGVWFDKKSNKWCAEIILNKRKYFLGRYNSKIDAIKKRFNYECLLFDIYSPYYQKDGMFVYEGCGYKLTVSCESLKPVDVNVEVEEISYEELQTISSERGSGALGSSGK